jgi:DNA-binding NarL/FixJ family response regulator
VTARRILIADDHDAARRGIRMLIESHSDWTVCAEARDGSDAVEKARRFRPDVVLLDVSMPRLNGLDAAREIRRVAPAAQTVVLTTHVADQLAGEARRAGAAEVIAKSHAGDTLIPAIEALPAPEATVHFGGAPVCRHRHIAAIPSSRRSSPKDWTQARRACTSSIRRAASDMSTACARAASTPNQRKQSSGSSCCRGTRRTFAMDRSTGSGALPRAVE